MADGVAEAACPSLVHGCPGTVAHVINRSTRPHTSKESSTPAWHAQRQERRGAPSKVHYPNVQSTVRAMHVQDWKSQPGVLRPSTSRSTMHVEQSSTAACPLYGRIVFQSISHSPMVQHIGQPRRNMRPSGTSRSAPQNTGANHTASARNKNPPRPRKKCSVRDRDANIISPIVCAYTH